MESKMKNRFQLVDKITMPENGNHLKEGDSLGIGSPNKGRVVNGDHEMDVDDDPHKHGRNKKNIIEKKRKDRTKFLVHQLADMIPPDRIAQTKLTSMNIILENVVEYMGDVRQQNQMMIAGKGTDVQNAEIKRLKALVISLTDEKEKLENALKQGGISGNFDQWKHKNSYPGNNNYPSVSNAVGEAMANEGEAKKKGRNKNRISSNLQQPQTSVQVVKPPLGQIVPGGDSLSMPSLIAGGNFLLPGNTPVPAGTPFISPSGTLRIADENMSGSSVPATTPQLNMSANAMTAVTQSVDIGQPRMAIGQPPVTNASPVKTSVSSAISTQQGGNAFPQNTGQVGSAFPQNTGQSGTAFPQNTGQGGTAFPQNTGQGGTAFPQNTGQVGSTFPQNTGQLGSTFPQNSSQGGSAFPQTAGQPGLSGLQVNSSQPLGQGIIITQTGQVIVLNEQGVPVNQYTAGPNFELPFGQRPGSQSGTPVNSASGQQGQFMDNSVSINNSNQAPSSAASVMTTSGMMQSQFQGQFSGLPPGQKPGVSAGHSVATNAMHQTSANVSQSQQVMNNPPLAIPGPGGLLQVNTRPSHPNQLPSALILPNGQLIPVVTQPHMMVQPPNSAAPGLLMPTNAQQQHSALNFPQSQSDVAQNLVPASTAGTVLANGLLMTTAATMTNPTTSVNTVSSSIATTTTMFQPSIGQPLPSTTAASNLGMGSALQSNHLQVINSALPSTIATTSANTMQTSDSTGTATTAAPTNVVAGVNPQGMIILTLPPGAQQQQGIFLDPNSLVVQGSGRAKAGQRILMPKPANFDSAPTKKSSKQKKKAAVEKVDNESTASSLWNTPLLCGAGDTPTTTTVTQNVTTATAKQSKKKHKKGSGGTEKKNDTATDILAQAAESIFSDISPTMTGLHLDEENPLHIDTSATENDEDNATQVALMQNKEMTETVDTEPVKKIVHVHLESRSEQSKSPVVAKPGGHLKVAQPPSLVSQNKSLDSCEKNTKHKDSGKTAVLPSEPTKGKPTDIYSKSTEGTKKDSDAAATKNAASKESKVNRKRTRSNSGKKTSAVNQPKTIELLPETITFSENDLCDVLDQVESLGQSQEQESSSKKSAKQKDKSAVSAKKRKRNSGNDTDGGKSQSKTKEVSQDILDVFTFVSSPEDEDMLNSPRSKKGANKLTKLPAKPEKTSEEMFDEMFSPNATIEDNPSSRTLKAKQGSISSREKTISSKSCVESSVNQTHLSPNRSGNSSQNQNVSGYASNPAIVQPQIGSNQPEPRMSSGNLLPDTGPSVDMNSPNKATSRTNQETMNKNDSYVGAPKTSHIPISIPSDSIFARNSYNSLPISQKSNDVSVQDKMDKANSRQLNYSAESLFSPMGSAKPNHMSPEFKRQKESQPRSSHPAEQSVQKKSISNNKQQVSRDNRSDSAASRESRSNRLLARNQHSELAASRNQCSDLSVGREQHSDLPVAIDHQGNLPGNMETHVDLTVPRGQRTDILGARNQQSELSVGRDQRSDLANSRNHVRGDSSAPRDQRVPANNHSKEPVNRSNFFSAENFVQPNVSMERTNFDIQGNDMNNIQGRTDKTGFPPSVIGQDPFNFVPSFSSGNNTQLQDSLGSFIPSFVQKPLAPSIVPGNESFLGSLNNQSTTVTTTASTFTFSLTGTTTASSNSNYGNPMSHHHFPFYPLHPSVTSSSTSQSVSMTTSTSQSANAAPPLNLPFGLPPERLESNPQIDLTGQNRFNPGLEFGNPGLSDPKANYRNNPAQLKERQENTPAPMVQAQRPQSRQRPNSVNRSPQVSHGVDSFLNQSNFSSNSSQQITSPPLHHPPRRRESSDRHQPTVQQQQQQQQQQQSPYHGPPPDFGSPNPSFSASSYNPPPLQHSRSSSSASLRTPSTSTYMNPPREKVAVADVPQKKTKQSMSSASRAKASQNISNKQRQANALKQYEIDTNLSHSIFEAANPNFFPPMQSHSPQPHGRNDAPTYLPPSNFFGVPTRPLSNTSTHVQHKAPDNPFNPLFNHGRPQNGLGLNFQPPPGFPMNHPMSGSHSNPAIAPPHSTGISVTPHMPNFNLGNIFGEPPADGMNISPIKFPHGNHMLGPQPGMDHNALQHQAGAIYHNRPHPGPPSVMHGAMSINSLLSHGHHGFDARAMGPPMNGAMGPPFHGHGHPPSFGIPPTLNFHNA